MAGGNPFNMALDKNAANYTPLSPLSLIARTAYVYPDRIAAYKPTRCRLSMLRLDDPGRCTNRDTGGPPGLETGRDRSTHSRAKRTGTAEQGVS